MTNIITAVSTELNNFQFKNAIQFHWKQQKGGKDLFYKRSNYKEEDIVDNYGRVMIERLISVELNSDKNGKKREKSPQRNSWHCFGNQGRIC